jgi:hypothetical protein
MPIFKDEETIDALWKTFSEDVVHPDAPAIQRSEMKKAFYGGAGAMLAMMLHSPFNELRKDRDPVKARERTAATIRAWKKELDDFMESVLEEDHETIN